MLDIKKQLKNLIANELSQHNIIIDESREVEKILLDYLTVENKLIKVNKRNILLSKEIENKQLEPPYDKYFETIKRKIVNGESVNQYLSKRSLEETFHDRLLNDWAVHHLHLSDDKGETFVERSDLLLFALFASETCYFVQIYKHKENLLFVKQELMEIVYRNWPILLEQYRLEGINPNDPPYTETIKNTVRNKNANTVLQIGSNVFAPPGGGLVGSGHNFKHVHWTDWIMHDLLAIENEMRVKNNIFTKEIEKERKHIPDTLSYKLISILPTIKIYEENSKIEFNIPYSEDRQTD